MKKYLLTSPKIGGQIPIVYDANGGILSISFEQARMGLNQREYLLRNMPVTLTDADGTALLPLLASRHQGMQIVEAEVTFEFATWWAAYGKKINKARCLPLWNKLTVAQQVAAYLGIKKYEHYLSRDGGWRTKQDPENYLRNRAWENEY